MRIEETIAELERVAAARWAGAAKRWPHRRRVDCSPPPGRSPAPAPRTPRCSPGSSSRAPNCPPRRPTARSARCRSPPRCACSAAGAGSSPTSPARPVVAGGRGRRRTGPTGGRRAAAGIRRVGSDRLPRYARLTHLIACERVGPGMDGRPRNMRGEDIGAHTAPWTSSTPPGRPSGSASATAATNSAWAGCRRNWSDGSSPRASGSGAWWALTPDRRRHLELGRRRPRRRAGAAPARGARASVRCWSRRGRTT